MSQHWQLQVNNPRSHGMNNSRLVTNQGAVGQELIAEEE